MATTNHDSGLGEANSSYQPKVLFEEQRTRRPNVSPGQLLTPEQQEPYSTAELIRLFAAAASCPSDDAAALARTIGCVLAGVELPWADEVLEVEVAAGCVEVCGMVWTTPVGLPLPIGGGLTASDTAAGCRWADTTLGQHIELHRLDLTAEAMLASRHPAMAILTQPGVARDRLNDLMRAGAPQDADDASPTA